MVIVIPCSIIQTRIIYIERMIIVSIWCSTLAGRTSEKVFLVNGRIRSAIIKKVHIKFKFVFNSIFLIVVIERSEAKEQSVIISVNRYKP